MEILVILLWPVLHNGVVRCQWRHSTDFSCHSLFDMLLIYFLFWLEAISHPLCLFYWIEVIPTFHVAQIENLFRINLKTLNETHDNVLKNMSRKSMSCASVNSKQASKQMSLTQPNKRNVERWRVFFILSIYFVFGKQAKVRPSILPFFHFFPQTWSSLRRLSSIVAYIDFLFPKKKKTWMLNISVKMKRALTKS